MLSPKTVRSKLTSGLLGEQYVGIEPGGADANLADGDVVYAPSRPWCLENLIGQFLFQQSGRDGRGRGK